MVSDFAKEKVSWTQSMNISLAKFMENKPQIWDPKHPQYTNIAVRDEAFAAFAAEYNNEFSWQAVKDRWTNIRSTYGFYMRKLNAKKAKGENFKVNWFMWQPCKYLFKVHKFSDKKTGTVNKESTKNINNVNASEPPEEMSCNESSDSGANNYKISCEEIADNIVTVFKGVQNNALGADKRGYAVVGDAVTEALNRLSSYQAAQLIQKITKILADYDEHNPNNPNN